MASLDKILSYPAIICYFDKTDTHSYVDRKREIDLLGNHDTESPVFTDNIWPQKAWHG